MIPSHVGGGFVHLLSSRQVLSVEPSKLYPCGQVKITTASTTLVPTTLSRASYSGCIHVIAGKKVRVLFDHLTDKIM